MSKDLTSTLITPNGIKALLREDTSNLNLQILEYTTGVLKSRQITYAIVSDSDTAYCTILGDIALQKLCAHALRRRKTLSKNGVSVDYPIISNIVMKLLKKGSDMIPVIVDLKIEKAMGIIIGDPIHLFASASSSMITEDSKTPKDQVQGQAQTQGQAQAQAQTDKKDSTSLLSSMRLPIKVYQKTPASDKPQKKALTNTFLNLKDCPDLICDVREFLGHHLKGRISHKTPLRKFQPKKPDDQDPNLNQRFSIILHDNTDEIEVVFMGEKAINLHPKLHANMCIELIDGNARRSKAQYARTKHEFTITCSTHGSCRPIKEIPTLAPFPPLEICLVRELFDKLEKDTVDMIGVVLSDTGLIPPSTPKCNQNRRVISLVDREHAKFSITLWGDWAEQTQLTVGQVVVLIDVVVQEGANRYSLKHTSRSQLLTLREYFPDQAVVRDFINWTEHEFDASKVSSGKNDKSEKKLSCLADIQAEAKDLREGQALVYELIGQISRVTPEAVGFYPSCKKCMKKLVLFDGTPTIDTKHVSADDLVWKCTRERCNMGAAPSAEPGEYFPRPVWKSYTSVLFTDSSKSSFVQLFDESLVLLLGMSSLDLLLMKKNSPAQYARCIEALNHKHVRIRLVSSLKKQQQQQQQQSQPQPHHAREESKEIDADSESELIVEQAMPSNPNAGDGEHHGGGDGDGEGDMQKQNNGLIHSIDVQTCHLLTDQELADLLDKSEKIYSRCAGISSFEYPF